MATTKKIISPNLFKTIKCKKKTMIWKQDSKVEIDIKNILNHSINICEYYVIFRQKQ